jgi:uncharacterized protein YjbK
MPKMECELKYALENEAAYEKLRLSLGPPQAQLQQTNLYLEDPNSEQQAALRLRLERNLTDGTERRVLTYKRRAAVQSISAAYFVAHEYELEIEQSDWDTIATGSPTERQWKLEPLARFAETNGKVLLRALGEMENTRWTYPLPDGSLAELDRTQLPGNREDFELEIETDRPEPVERWVSARFRELGLELRPQPLTKFRRFLEQIR